MPVTAKLSRKFYEAFGEDLANELVDWFNSVDATYRSDLRELNELNFSRFDAKLEQRVAEFETKLERRVSELETKLEQRVGDLRRELGEVKSDLIKWMFAFWAPTVLALVALLLRK